MSNAAPRRMSGRALATLLPWLAVLALVLLWAAMQAQDLRDGIDDRSFEALAAQDLLAAQRQEARRTAQDRAISAACSGGIPGNAAWVDLPGGGHRCTTSAGRPTGVIVAGGTP